MYYVYRITCNHPDSKEKYYYGFRQNETPHTDNYWSSSQYLKLAIKKYGKNWFSKKIIKIFFDRNSAIDLECKLHEKFAKI